MFERKPAFDVSQIRVSSKIALKLSCLQASGNDIDTAEKLYRFISDGLDTLPDTEPTVLTGIQRFKSNADEVVQWLGAHREELQQGLSLFQTMKSKAVSSLTPNINLPEIPKP